MDTARTRVRVRGVSVLERLTRGEIVATLMVVGWPMPEREAWTEAGPTQAVSVVWPLLILDIRWTAGAPTFGAHVRRMGPAGLLQVLIARRATSLLGVLVQTEDAGWSPRGWIGIGRPVPRAFKRWRTNDW